MLSPSRTRLTSSSVRVHEKQRNEGEEGREDEIGGKETTHMTCWV